MVIHAGESSKEEPLYACQITVCEADGSGKEAHGIGRKDIKVKRILSEPG